MFRLKLLRWIIPCMIIATWSLFVQCTSNPPIEETTTQDATVPDTSEQEAVLDQVVTPEKPQPPPGLGDSCKMSPYSVQGTCPDRRLLCGTISATESRCFENCTESQTCTDEEEICRSVSEISNYPICVKLAAKGEGCGSEKRVICPGDSVNPPLYCIEGVCTERPKDGWQKGQPCTPPRGDDQSDCQSGLICVEHVKNDYRCIQKCQADGDCPTGESCWDGPLGKKVCLIAAKIGESCDPLKRRFCKTENPRNPITCKQGICRAQTELKQVGEACTKSVVPSEYQGNCDDGLACLGVSRLSSMCHKLCKSNSDCSAGQSCLQHPNIGPGDPADVCVIAVDVGQSCDLTKQVMCKQPTDVTYKCKTPDENIDAGVCVKVDIGDACVNDADCGKMICIRVTEKDRYCLVGCDPKAPKCPDNGGCQMWGQDGPTACIPTGPRQEDDPCTALQGGSEKLNTSALCTGGLACVRFSDQSAEGICMQQVAQCTATACTSPGHICLATQTGGFCGLDCSQNPNVCKPNTKCLELAQLKAKVCGPNI
jgi:hypothetical protein